MWSGASSCRRCRTKEGGDVDLNSKRSEYVRISYTNFQRVTKDAWGLTHQR